MKLNAEKEILGDGTSKIVWFAFTEVDGARLSEFMVSPKAGVGKVWIDTYSPFPGRESTFGDIDAEDAYAIGMALIDAAITAKPELGKS